LVTNQGSIEVKDNCPDVFWLIHRQKGLAALHQ